MGTIVEKLYQLENQLFVVSVDNWSTCMELELCRLSVNNNCNSLFETLLCNPRNILKEVKDNGPYDQFSSEAEFK